MSNVTTPPTAILAASKLLDGPLDTWFDILTAASDAWTPYTPTLTNVTLGTGTQVNNAKYKQVGKTVDFVGTIVLGTGGALTGLASVSLPVTAAVDATTGAGLGAGTALLFDSSTAANRQPGAVTHGASTLVFWGTGGQVAATVPFAGTAWAVGDFIRYALRYEAA